MDQLMRPKMIQPYGRTKANAACRKHPKHLQSPGVCSLCLNQKLSQLTITTSALIKASSPSSSSSSSYISSLSSSDSSSYSSPVVTYRATKSTRAFNNLGQETLKKSRSMVFFLQNNGKNNKRGFWSRLFLLPKKNKALLMHSNIAAAVQ